MQATSLTQTIMADSAPSRQSYPVIPPGHSGRLKYADPRDLPSYPSTGLPQNGSSAGAAASLGWANQKSLDLWKPDKSASAGAAASLGWANQKPRDLWKPDKSASASAAAVLAKDYKMAKQWEPERSLAGSKAAIAAAESAGRPKNNQPASPSAWGSSAANLAFAAGRTSAQQHQAESSNSSIPLDRQPSMYAAKGAFAGQRPRAQSSPIIRKPTPADSPGNNSASHALSAATIAHRPRAPTIPIEEAGAVPYTTLGRQMFTSHPPVKIETDEQKRQDVLHASAVAMAKRMFNNQQNMINQTKANQLGRSSSFNRHDGRSESDDGEEASRSAAQFGTLQEAAYRLAQERLSKLQEEHERNRDYAEYYGSKAPARTTTRLGTIRGKLTRKRSSSDGEVIMAAGSSSPRGLDTDRQRSREIRQQMSSFSNKLSAVDEAKRSRDREALLAAAQRNVKARLQTMDEKVYQDTGRVAPSLMSEWEHKAHMAASARSEARRDDAGNSNYGKVDIGGGMFMDQAAVDAIAAKRVKPVLDEISEKAEAERARQAELKLEEEKKREEEEKKRAREREIADIHKKLKEQQRDEEKAVKAEARREEKVKKDAERDAKRQAKDEKRKTREIVPVAPADATAETETRQIVEPSAVPTAAETKETEVHKETKEGKKLPFLHPKLHTKLKDKESEKEVDDKAQPSPPLPGETSPASEGDATSPKFRMKDWLKSRFTRPRRKTVGSTPDEEMDSGKKGGFIGGAALARLGGDDGNNSSADSLDNRSASMREVALAGRSSSRAAAVDEPGESSKARDEGLVSGGSNRNSNNKNDEDGSSMSSSDEDAFYTEPETDGSAKGSTRHPLSALPPPRKIVDPIKPRTSGSPIRESRFSEVLDGN